MTPCFHCKSPMRRESPTSERCTSCGWPRSDETTVIPPTMEEMVALEHAQQVPMHRKIANPKRLLLQFGEELRALPKWYQKHVGPCSRCGTQMQIETELPPQGDFTVQFRMVCRCAR